MRGAAHKILDDVNVEILSQIICYNKNKVLIWDGYKSNGGKNQYWVDGAVDLELHVKGIKKQGAQLSDNGYSKNIVIDVDRKGLPAAEIGKAAYKIDNKLVIFPSPSGEKWHVWKFYNKRIEGLLWLLFCKSFQALLQHPSPNQSNDKGLYVQFHFEQF